MALSRSSASPAPNQMEGRMREETGIAPYMALFPMTLAVWVSEAPNRGNGYEVSAIICAIFSLMALWGAVEIIKGMYR